jgi:hypothetical protein
LISDINPLHENICIVGLAQSGKSNLAAWLIAKFVTQGYHVIADDPHNKWGKLAPLAITHDYNTLGKKNLEIIQTNMDSPKQFNELCGKVFNLKNKIFFRDELHNVCSKNRAESNLQLLSRNCNNRNIGYVFVFQRPQEVPNMVLSNAHHVFGFPLELKKDREYMVEWLSEDFLQFSESNVPKYTCLYKKQGKRETEFFRAPQLI